MLIFVIFYEVKKPSWPVGFMLPVNSRLLTAALHSPGILNPYRAVSIKNSALLCFGQIKWSSNPAALKPTENHVWYVFIVNQALPLLSVSLSAKVRVSPWI